MELETTQPSARRLQGYVVALTATAVGLGATLALLGLPSRATFGFSSRSASPQQSRIGPPFASARRSNCRFHPSSRCSPPCCSVRLLAVWSALPQNSGTPNCSTVSERGRSPHLKWLTYTSTRFLTGAAMGLTAEAVRGRFDGTAGLVVATVAASAVGELLEITFASITLRVRGKPTAILRMIGPADGDCDLLLRPGSRSTRARLPRSIALVCVSSSSRPHSQRSGYSACIRHSEHSRRSLRPRTSRLRSRW